MVKKIQKILQNIFKQFAACSRCKLLECERDALKAQLNREIGLKEEFLAQNEEQDKALREMRRQAEELRSELESGRAKVEEIEQKLQVFIFFGFF